MERLDRHEFFERTVPQEPIFEDPIIREAWRHGLIGTAAINEYIRTVYQEDFILSVGNKELTQDIDSV